VPARKCGCARTGQLTSTRATRATGATDATRLIPAALGSPHRPGATQRPRAAGNRIVLKQI
jgi:hypothetical protein